MCGISEVLCVVFMVCSVLYLCFIVCFCVNAVACVAFTQYSCIHMYYCRIHEHRGTSGDEYSSWNEGSDWLFNILKQLTLTHTHTIKCRHYH